jgi:hypothetical protein
LTTTNQDVRIYLALEKQRRKIMASLLVALFGLIAALFIGLYLGLYGGIIDIINGAQTQPVDAGHIAFGIVRIVVAEPVAVIVFLLGLGIAKEID